MEPLRLVRPGGPTASPSDWRDEVLYLLMPDRFSDGGEAGRPLLGAGQVGGDRLDAWADSGHQRFQGGTLRGAITKLDYLNDLGVTTIWLGPPWKGRAERNDYHGYAVQDFAAVDPRIGTEEDLVELIAEAHERGIRVILDVIVNHTGPNWFYQSQLDEPGSEAPPFRSAVEGPYPFGAWIRGDGTALPAGTVLADGDDGVWPAGPLQLPDAYHRAGAGSYGEGDPASAYAEFRWADWYNRDLALSGGPVGNAVLEAMIGCWSRWLRVTDCDGFRIDTFKHIRVEEARRFCAAVREQAEALGKDNFLLVAEVGGGDSLEEDYLQLLGSNLTAVLEVGEVRQRLRAVAGGQAAPAEFFGAWRSAPIAEPSATSEASDASRVPGTHRNLGSAFVYSLDDHDNLWIPQERFATQFPGRTVPAVAMLTLTLGIPCLYYGTEQALAIPPEILGRLPHLNDAANGGDRYLREAMFGPSHPRHPGRAGRPDAANPWDEALPGFGPRGTSGLHAFDPSSPTFKAVEAILRARTRHVTLRRGRQYLREIRSGTVGPFGYPRAGGLTAWSRILADTEIICIVNLDPDHSHTADVSVDATVSPEGAVFVADLRTSADSPSGGNEDRATCTVSVEDGRHFVRLPVVSAAEVLVLVPADAVDDRPDEVAST